MMIRLSQMHRTPCLLVADRNYSTRRIRRQVYSRDLATVQEKQITIPVNVPWALEDYLLSTLPEQYGNIPPHFTSFRPLIPVHDASRYDPSTATLPSLQDTATEIGNLRYWVITNESMWAQQHRVLDEIAELMWSLFHCFVQSEHLALTGVVALERKWYLALSSRRRIVLSEVSDQSSVAMKAGLPTLRETLLFRSWASASPNTPELDRRGFGNSHELFNDPWILYPFPNDLFWHASDEGNWDEEGVPSWTDPPAGNTKVERPA